MRTINSLFYTMLFMITPMISYGASINWTGGNSGTVAWAGNWDSGPSAGDDATISATGSLTITGVPTISLNSLTVTGGGTVTLQGSTVTLTLGGNAGTDFTISSGTTLIIDGTGNIVNITMAASATADISGTFQINGGATFNTDAASVVSTVATSGTISNAGALTCSTASKLVFNGASTYTHSQNGGTIPTSTWNGTSLCNITGITSTQVSGLGQAFVNVTWNCSSQTVAQEIAYTGTWSGTLTVTATNTGSLNVGNSGSIYTLTVGTFNQTGGTFNIRGGSASQPSDLTVTGNFTLTSGGTFDIAVAAGAGTQVDLSVGGNFTHSGSNNFKNTESSTSYRLNFNGTGIQNIQSTGQNGNLLDINFTNSGAGAYCNIVNNTKFKVDGSTSTIDISDNASIASGELTVNGTFEISGSSANLTISASADLLLNDSLIRTTSTNPTISGSLTLGSSGVYQHNCNGGAIPTLTWTSGSTCSITGVVATIPTGLSQTFHHFIWNCSSQTASGSTANFGGNITTVNGNLKFLNSGTGQIQLRRTCGDYDLTVSGDFEVTNSDIMYMNGTSCGSAYSATFNVSGSFTIGSGGTFNCNSPDGSAGVTINYSGTSTQTFSNSGTLTNTNMNWNVNSSAILQLATNLPVAASRTLTIASSGSLVCGTGSTDQTNSFNITGAGAFTLSSTGILKATSTAGVSASGTATGNILTTGGRTYNAGGKYHYIGTAAQNTGNGLPATVNSSGSLVINNSAGVTLTQSTTLDGTLTLTSGILTTTATEQLTLDVNSPKTISGSSTAYVAGPLKRNTNTNSSTEWEFPVGAGNSYYKIGILTTANTSTSSTDFTIEVFKREPTNYAGTKGAGVNHIANFLEWSISATGANTESQIKLYWTEGGFGVDEGNLVDLLVVHYTAGEWQSKGNNSTSAGSNYIIANASTGYSFHTFGSGNGNHPLPVSLLNFDAKPVVDKIEINWSTASEENNDYFTVERSTDGEVFEEVTKVPGAGNSNTLLFYTAIDNSPIEGTSYYRLKQTDFDGNYSYSDVDAVDLQGLHFINNFKVFPNPASNNSFNIKFFAQQNSEVEVIIYNNIGSSVFKKTVNAVKGDNLFEMDLQNRTSGLYFIEIRENGESLKSQVVKL